MKKVTKGFAVVALCSVSALASNAGTSNAAHLTYVCSGSQYVSTYTLTTRKSLTETTLQALQSVGITCTPSF
jgi:4-hydroxy-3-methylbut-2-enyl diphosphate reductase IspH